MEVTFMRDKNRAESNKRQRKYLLKYTISHDSYTSLSTTFAKYPFSEKTISKVIYHISIKIGTKLIYNVVHT